MASAEASPVRRSHGSELYVSELQRSRLLSATFALVGERGYEGVSARSVSERAGVSNRTFYQAFSDREDCFLAAFDHAIGALEPELRAAWGSEREWSARVRGGLAVLLEMLDREPAVRRLVFVEALAAGPRVLARRARVLEVLAGAIDAGRAGRKAPAGLPALTSAAVVGATFGVIHARLLEASPEPLIELLGPLMAAIVLPYRGGAAAARELERSAPTGRRGASGSSTQGAKRAAHTSERGRRPIGARPAQPIAALWPLGAASPVDYRLTVRTQMALAAVAGRPGLNNREVSELIGLADQGQISRMMKRLSEHGLVENTQAHTRRLARAWRLTPQGEAAIDAHRGGRVLTKARRKTGKGGKLIAGKGGRGGKFNQAGFRMTALTHDVLLAVGKLRKDGVNPTNREIAELAGVKDEGQISRLLARLESHDLLENTGGRAAGGNAWRLTLRGEELLSASRPNEGRTV